MASLFWVAGTASYDGTTNRFATTSGGTATIAAVTSSDDVTVDGAGAGGGGTMTIGAAFSCNSLTVTSATNTMTVACDGSHGITAVGAVTLTKGTLNTNGQTCSWGSFSSSNSNTRTLTMGASAISITAGGTTAWNTNIPTNLTVTSNTATLTFNGTANQQIAAGLLNFQGASIVCNGTGGMNSSTIGTCANFTRVGLASKIDTLTLNNMTVTGTLTIGGNSTQGVNRLLILSSGTGTQRTITSGAYVITGDVDFIDMNLAYSGGASWTNSGNAYIGDCGGNGGAVTTNANSPATQTNAATGANFTWSTSAHWTSGRVPLPQDNVTISGSFTGKTITMDMPRTGTNIDLSGVTGNPALAWNNPDSSRYNIFGNFTLATGITWSGGANTWFLCRSGTQTFTSNSVTISGNVLQTILTGATFSLGSDLTSNGNTGGVSVNGSGTFDANNFNVTTNTAGFTGNTGQIIKLGNGTWTIKGTGSAPQATNNWNMNNNITVLAQGSTINFTDTGSTGKTFTGGGKKYNILQFKQGGSGGLTITGNNTFKTLDLECTTARTITLPAAGVQTINSTLTLIGASGQVLTISSATPGTATTLNTLTYSSNAFVSPSGDIRINVVGLLPALM